MLFHIIEIYKNFSKSPQRMLPGHIFLLTWDGEVSLCHGRRTMGSVGQHPRGASQGSILCTFWQAVLLPPPQAKPSAVKPLHLSCPSNLVWFFSSLGARFSVLLRANCCPSPRWQAGGKLTKALLTWAVLPDFRGERIFFVKGLLVWVNNPLIVTFEVLLKLKRDDKTDVEWRYFFPKGNNTNNTVKGARIKPHFIYFGS